MGVEDRDYHRDRGGASGAGFIRSCPRCGRSFPSALWRMHAHNPQQARCGEAGCLERGVGYRPDAPSAEGLGPLCAEHLMRHRRQGHDVRFVDGGVCSVCDGHGQTASHTGEWLRCPQCFGAGYESEDVVERRRERARQEEKEARRREENRRAAEEARRRSEEASRAAEERRRSEARYAEEERRRSEARHAEEERRRSEARRTEGERRRSEEASRAEEERRRSEAWRAEEERRRQAEPPPWGGYAGRAAQGQCPSCGGAGRVATKYHRVLDIPLGASPDEITQAFRRKAMQHHPDRNKAPDATLRMQEVSEARAMLVGSESIRAGAECSLCNGRGAVAFDQPWQGQAQRGRTEREPAGHRAGGNGGGGASSGSGGGQSGSGGGSSGGSGWGWFWIAAVIGVFAAFVYFSRETPSPAFSPAASAPTRTPQAVRAFNPTPTATRRPTPTPLPAVAATWTPNPTWTPQPTWTPTPTATPNPTWTPAPTWTPTPASPDGATAVRAPPPQPTATPTPRPTPRPTSTPRPATGQESLEEVAARVRPSVVHVTAGRSAGSGVIVETDSSGRAIIVTNHHVIEESTNRVRVQVEDSSWHSAVVHGSDAARDLAVLSICCSQDFRAASLSGARAPQGASVFAMGYPVDVFASGVASLTDGVVSRVFLDTEGRRWLVQTNAEINPGNSGGPLFAMSGEVVGINAFIQRETAGGLNIEGYGFAVASETVIDVLPTLKAGRTLGGATPTPTPWSLWGGSRDGFGPADGAMPNEDDNYIETYATGMHIRNLSAQATFQNPSSSVGGWDYGFLFRSAGDNRFHAVVVTVNGTWFHYLRNGSADGNAIDSGHTDALRTWDGAPNELRLVAIASIGWFFINGELVATLDLTDGPEVGDVALVTDYHLVHERDGGLTRFQGFAVREPRLVETASGELEHADDGLIKSQWVASGVGDFIVSATFINPYAADVGSWDYGVKFRDDPNRRNAFDAVTISSDGTWRHFRRDGANASVHSDSGRARVNLGAKAGNTLWLMAVGGAGVLSVNREPADALDLSGAPLMGGVWVGTGFYEGNEVPGYATSYADVEVWSLD